MEIRSRDSLPGGGQPGHWRNSYDQALNTAFALVLELNQSLGDRFGWYGQLSRAATKIHLDVHEAALGHTHLDLRYLLLGPDTDPMPPPDESPDARWFSWDEAMAMADPALIDALPLARAVFEAMP